MQAVGKWLVNDHHRDRLPPARGLRETWQAHMSARPRGTAKATKSRAWQRMLSGRRLDLLDLCRQRSTLKMEDIAHVAGPRPVLLERAD